MNSQEQKLVERLKWACDNCKTVEVRPLEARELLDLIDQREAAPIGDSAMKVLAPNPECKTCMRSEIPGTVDIEFNIPVINQGRPRHDTIKIRAVCHCVRAVEIVAESTVEFEIPQPGAPAKVVVKHIPIVKKPQ